MKPNPLRLKNSLLAWIHAQRAARFLTVLSTDWRIAFVAVALTATCWFETRTSILQSVVLPAIGSRLTWRLAPGASPSIVFPDHGPLDATRGYTRIPEFQQRLESRGFGLSEQARFSDALSFTTRLGISPPVRERSVAGLVVRDREGQVLYDATRRVHRFRRFEDVPDLVVKTLLLMENRQLEHGLGSRANPAVDWGRLARAAVLAGGSRVGLPFAFQGGSTLAVQIEKYRHSQNGRTGSPADKLRQIAAASLKVYRDGPDTRAKQREIILDYLNSMPLGAAPGYGEVHGLGEGLRAWFGLDPDRTFATLGSDEPAGVRARAAAAVLALLCAVRAPSRLLAGDHAELERRVSFYADRLRQAGVLEPDVYQGLADAPFRYRKGGEHERVPFENRETADAVRRQLIPLLGVRNFYELGRLDLEVESTFDMRLQDSVLVLFRRLEKPDFVAAQGLRDEHLLADGDPARVAYSLILIERTGSGDVLSVLADNLDRPFDLNLDMRMELGSTAKLRTLAHYLNVIERIHGELHDMDARTLAERNKDARDPLTAWVATRLLADPDVPLARLLELSLDRTYRATPNETFFTGGGVHTFVNFDPKDNPRTLTLREALVHSTNLVFIRLMRDLVRYHEARLPYDAQAVLAGSDSLERRRLLGEASDEESRAILARAYRRMRGNPPQVLLDRIVEPGAPSARKLALVFFAWHPSAPAESLATWLAAHGTPVTREGASKLTRSYGSLAYGIRDYAYLLRRHPVELWCAGEMVRDPEASLAQLVERSVPVRRDAQRWLFETRHPGPQQMRLRTRVERDAFDRMAADWRNVGFPFGRLVPSYATAIGSSADRPEALAELMGILVNDGERPWRRSIGRLRFAAGTPYETSFERQPKAGQRVMSVEAARTLHAALAQVVERGTAQRLRGVFRGAPGDSIVVGGKTGSGDNRFDIFARGGRLVGSRVSSRTAAFAFYIGDRYYGVITASVVGRMAGQYAFTSALPLQVLKLLAPEIDARLAKSGASPVKPATTAANVGG